MLEDYGTHTHATVKAWLAKHPRVHLHLTPTSASWTNLLEVFFSIITRQAIRRGSFPRVGDLVAAIRRFVDGWNQRCQPFVWAKDPDDIMIKATRKQTSSTEHPREARTVSQEAAYLFTGLPASRIDPLVPQGRLSPPPERSRPAKMDAKIAPFAGW